MRLRPDPLGALLFAVGASALVFAPMLLLKPNRILPGQGRALLDLLPPWMAVALCVVLAAAALLALFVQRPWWRLGAAAAALALLAIAIGHGADALTPAGNRVLRVAPGPAAWVVLVVLGLMATDALTTLRLGAGARVLVLLLVLLATASALGSGQFDQLSVMREYAVNADRFGHEALRHVALALGSLLAALVVALPLGLACHRHDRLRAAVLPALNLVQTVPSIALLGILIAPLAALAAAVPALAAIGVSGIGAAPALVALFLYSLLPVVANTVTGLARVSPAAVDAARGMGMTDAQVLREVELPLAIPAILAGVRIVLVQNIGLCTLAALIGSGGLGAFVFQGIGQAAIDLVLLGAIPIVALAFAASVLLDALVESSRRRTA